ncbi:YbjN domain-containing protein [bacterium]|nr:YbjN domain-containing protein [bacterium]
MSPLNRDTLENWLDDKGIRFYLCQDCDGLHLSDTEEHLGVLESRLLLEDNLLIISTELSVRPSAVLPLHGSMQLINFDNPLVKVGLSLYDDDVPRLVISGALPVVGLEADYFAQYLEQVLTATSIVLDHATQMDVLLLDDLERDAPDGDALH